MDLRCLFLLDKFRRRGCHLIDIHGWWLIILLQNLELSLHLDTWHLHQKISKTRLLISSTYVNFSLCLIISAWSGWLQMIIIRSIIYSLLADNNDSVKNGSLILQNGVRGLMLDMYDFQNDIWLCHSFDGRCYGSTTAFVRDISNN